jgi:RNA polymerase sigma factor (sigma-70 family)
MSDASPTLEALYREHASAVYRFAWGLSGDRTLAEDMVSETFLRLLTAPPRIETRTALAYLLTITRNTYLNRLRRRRRETALPVELTTPDRDLDQELDGQARLRTVLMALAQLPEGERAALLLRVDHELPYSDIANALGTSEGAAKVRVHRARVRLSRALEKQEEKDDARSDS